MNRKRLALGLALLAASAVGSSGFGQGTVKNPLKFSRFQIPSETASDWIEVAKSDADSGADVMGLFKHSKHADRKLIAFRESGAADNVCSKNKADLKSRKVKFTDLETPRGWACAWREEVGGTPRMTAMKTFFVKGPKMSTSFSIVMVGEAIPQDQFMKDLKSLKESL